MKTILLSLTGFAAAQCLFAAQITSSEFLTISIQSASSSVTAAGVAGTGIVTINGGTQTGSPSSSVSINSPSFSLGSIFLDTSFDANTNAPGDSITDANFDIISQTVKVTNSGSTAETFTIPATGSHFSAQTAGPTSASFSVLFAIEEFNARTVQWDTLESLNLTIGTGSTATGQDFLSTASVDLGGNTFADIRLHEHITGSISLAAPTPEPGTFGLVSASLAVVVLLIRRRRARR